MKIKIYQCTDVKIKYDDDLVKVKQYFKDKANLDIEFTPPEITPVLLKNATEKLYKPNDNGQQEFLLYVFDYSQRSHSFTFHFSRTLKVIEVGTWAFDETVDRTWKTFCHEIIHSIFFKLFQ